MFALLFQAFRSFEAAKGLFEDEAVRIVGRTFADASMRVLDKNFWLLILQGVQRNVKSWNEEKWSEMKSNVKSSEEVNEWSFRMKLSWSLGGRQGDAWASILAARPREAATWLRYSVVKHATSKLHSCTVRYIANINYIYYYTDINYTNRCYV